MEENDKQPLIRDICARLPYGVYVKFKQYNEPLCLSVKDALAIYNGGEIINDLQYLYLRPMSSMTEKEKKEFKNLFDGTFQIDQGVIISDSTKWNKNEAVFVDDLDCTNLIDWLISNHFDFRCLIPMSLALKAPKDMYKEK